MFSLQGVLRLFVMLGTALNALDAKEDATLHFGIPEHNATLNVTIEVGTLDGMPTGVATTQGLPSQLTILSTLLAAYEGKEEHIFAEDGFGLYIKTSVAPK